MTPQGDGNSPYTRAQTWRQFIMFIPRSGIQITRMAEHQCSYNYMRTCWSYQGISIDSLIISTVLSRDSFESHLRDTTSSDWKFKLWHEWSILFTDGYPTNTEIVIFQKKTYAFKWWYEVYVSGKMCCLFFTLKPMIIMTEPDFPSLATESTQMCCISLILHGTETDEPINSLKGADIFNYTKITLRVVMVF